MNLQDQIAADQQAVHEAQTALLAANAKLAEDQAKLEAIAPHLSVLDRLEAHIATAEESVKQGVLNLVAELRNLINR
jgi:hypothetical protein